MHRQSRLGVLMGDVIHAGIFELELWKTVGPLTNEGAKLHVMKALGRGTVPVGADHIVVAHISVPHAALLIINHGLDTGL